MRTFMPIKMLRMAQRTLQGDTRLLFRKLLFDRYTRPLLLRLIQLKTGDFNGNKT
jgi:hypothetical protein